MTELRESEVPDAAERICTYRFASGYQCAALPADEIHTSTDCELGHPDDHHTFSPPLRPSTAERLTSDPYPPARSDALSLSAVGREPDPASRIGRQ